MQVSPSNGTNSVFRSTDTVSEPLSDLAILRQPIPDDSSVDDKRDLQQQKRDILDKLIKQRPMDVELDLSSVNLSSINLQRAKLQKVNLNKACLSGANLDTADLSNATLKYARLSNANLNCAYFPNAKLNMATLSHANLFKTNLMNADLSYANLNEAKLNNVFLQAAILKNTKLMNASIQQIQFVKATMDKANFSNSDLYLSDFTDADLTNANLSNTKLNFTNFTNAKLNKAILSEADFTCANLNGAVLTGANLDNAKLNYIYLPEWNSEHLDIYLNHINNNSSLLTTIDSIDAKYHAQKIALVHQLINSLDKRPANVSLTSVVDSLLDTLAKAPYNQDPKIINWLNNNILPLYLAKYDTSMMPLLKDSLLFTLLTYIENKPELMFNHNGTFIQLISQAMGGIVALKNRLKFFIIVIYKIAVLPPILKVILVIMPAILTGLITRLIILFCCLHSKIVSMLW